MRRRRAKVATERRTSAAARGHSKRGSPKSAQACPESDPAATRVDSVTVTSLAGSATAGSWMVTGCQRRSVQRAPASTESFTSRRQSAAGTATAIVNSTAGGCSAQTCGDMPQSQTKRDPEGTVAWNSTPAGG